MANKYGGVVFKALAIRETPTNTALRFNLTPVRKAIIKGREQQQMLAKMGWEMLLHTTAGDWN